jgi:hypothetical protein
MSERLRVPPSHASAPERELTLEDVRRRLEGRMELIEAASKRYALLEKRLKSISWKDQLRARPELAHEVLAQEDLLEEAISRTRRRGELEGWPETLPALEPLREVLRRRAQVEGLVRKRLEELTGPTEPPSLKRDLAHLEKLVRKVPSIEIGPGETRLLEMKRNQAIPRPLVVLIVLFIPFLHLMSLLAGPNLVLGLVGVFFTLLAAFILRAGEFWLTSERLIWKPVMGEPVTVSLRSIREGGIHLKRFSRSLRVQGDRTVYVRYVEPLEQLAALLELHRQLPLLDASRSGVRLPDVSFYPATFREWPDALAQPGWAVLRPQGVSFLPLGAGPRLLEAVTGTPPPPGMNIEVPWVLEELRWLSDTGFDTHLARAVKLTGGTHWPASETGRNEGVPVWKEIHLTRGPGSIKGKVDWSQQAGAERVFGVWPPSSEP